MYELELSEKIDKIFTKLSKRNIKQLEIINKKVQQILQNPYHFKPLKNELKNIRRVHIDSSFVLTYEIKENIIRLLDYDHHDKIYNSE